MKSFSSIPVLVLCLLLCSACSYMIQPQSYGTSAKWRQSSYLDLFHYFDINRWIISNNIEAGGRFASYRKWDMVKWMYHSGHKTGYVGLGIVKRPEDDGKFDYAGSELLSVDKYYSGCFSYSIKADGAPGSITNIVMMAGDLSGPLENIYTANIGAIYVKNPGKVSMRTVDTYAGHESELKDHFEFGDITNDFHTYSIKISSKGVEWYFDHKLVDTNYGSKAPLPKHGPYQIHITNSVLADGFESLIGSFTSTTPVYSILRAVKYIPGDDCKI